MGDIERQHDHRAGNPFGVEITSVRWRSESTANAEQAAPAANTNDALVDRPRALWKQPAMGKT